MGRLNLEGIANYWDIVFNSAILLLDEMFIPQLYYPLPSRPFSDPGSGVILTLPRSPAGPAAECAGLCGAVGSVGRAQAAGCGDWGAGGLSSYFQSLMRLGGREFFVRGRMLH